MKNAIILLLFLVLTHGCYEQTAEYECTPINDRMLLDSIYRDGCGRILSWHLKYEKNLETNEIEAIDIMSEKMTEIDFYFGDRYRGGWQPDFTDTIKYRIHSDSGNFIVNNSALHPEGRECTIKLPSLLDSNCYFRFMGLSGNPTRDTLCFGDGNSKGKYYFYSVSKGGYLVLLEGKTGKLQYS